MFCVSLIVIDRGDGRIRSLEAIPLYDEFAKELGPDEIYGFLHGAEATWLRFRHVGDCTYHAGSTENESTPSLTVAVGRSQKEADPASSPTTSSNK